MRTSLDHRGTVRPSWLAVFRLTASSNRHRLYYGQIGRFLAVQDLAGITPDLPISLGEAWSVADQSTGKDELAPRIAGGKTVVCRELNQAIALTGEQWVGGDEESARFERLYLLEGSPEFAFASGRHDVESEPHPIGC